MTTLLLYLSVNTIYINSMIFKTINSNTFVLIPGNYDLLPSIKANVDISDDPLETVCMNMTEETKRSFYKLYNTYCKLDNFDKFSEI